MRPFSPAFFEALQKRRAITLTLFCLVLMLAAGRFYSLHLDSSITSLLPDSSASLAKGAALMDTSPAMRVLLVEFTLPHSDAATLRQASESFQRKMQPFIYQAVDAGAPQALDILDMLPWYFDADMEAKVTGMMTEAHFKERLGEFRASLRGPLGFMPVSYFQDDPLNFMSLVLGRFNSQGEQRGGKLSLTSPSADGKSLLQVLRPLASMNDIAGASATVAALNAAKIEVQEEFAGLKVKAAGSLLFTAENNKTIEGDLRFTMLLSIGFIALIYLILVRSLGVIWLLATPVVAVIFSGAALSSIWPSTAGIALGFGAAVLGLAEDYAVLVHFGLRKNRQAKGVALSRLARPMSYSALLCASSFCVLMFSSIPALRQLGFFAAFSLFCGLMIALFVLPCCPFMDRPAISSVDDGQVEQGGLVALARLRLRRGILCLLVAVCLGFCAFSYARLGFDADFRKMGVASAELTADVVDLTKRWQGAAEMEVWVSSGSSLEDAIAASAKLTEMLRTTGGKGGVFSLADILPAKELREQNTSRWQKFKHAQASQLTSNLATWAEEAGLKKGAFKRFASWLSTDASATSPAELLQKAGMGELLWWMHVQRGGESHVLTIVQGSAPALAASPAPELLEHGTPLSSSIFSAALSDAFAAEKRLLPVAGLICLALLTLCFRRWDLVLLSALPPLLGLCSIFAWLILSGSSLNLAAAAALTLVIGLGADYGIVMLHELSAGRSMGAFRSILVSSLTTLAGLGVLFLAKHPVLHALGGVTFFGLLAEMLTVLLLVPFLCREEG